MSRYRRSVIACDASPCVSTLLAYNDDQAVAYANERGWSLGTGSDFCPTHAPETTQEEEATS